MKRGIALALAFLAGVGLGFLAGWDQRGWAERHATA